MARPKKCPRAWLPWTLTVGLVVLAVAFATLASTSGPSEHSRIISVTSFAPGTGFGGYRWSGPVDEISAQWRVPSIRSTSKPGTALVWIGAQSRNDGGAFIQLGSFAYLPKQSASRQGHKASESNGPSYGVFWSDTSRQFKPVELLGLMHSGDLISFQMQRNAQGWRLTAQNLTFHWIHSIEVSYGAGSTYNQGEWLQEGPAVGAVADKDVPYADISTVTFKHLKINRHPPHLRFADAQAFATVSGIYLVPSKQEGDRFSLLPAKGATRQYLRDAEQFDAASDPIALQIVVPKPKTQQSPESIAQALDNAYLALESQLRTQRWPASTRPAIAQVVRDIGIIRTRIAEWATSKGATTNALRQIVGSPEVRRDLKQVKARLGLPPN
jgi:hypothetical protein